MGKHWFTACMMLSGATILAAIANTRAIPQSQAPDGELHYTASCAVAESYSVDGFVSNASADTYQVRGEVRFKFVQANSMSGREIQAQADAVIPAGETARVAHARLTFLPSPKETCLFDVAQAIRKE